MAKRMKRIGGALALGLVAYLVLWPVPIDPVGWEPPPVRAATGALASNEKLRAAERLAVELIEGPEDVAVDEDGRMYVGTADGRIVVVSRDGATATTLAETGGRPLGLDWDGQGNLVVADAGKGLLRVTRDGELTTLSTESDGVPYRFTDDVDVAADDRIYFTDASDKFGYGQHLEDILEGRGHGRLLRYDPRTGTSETLLDGLHFANGVAVAPDASYVLVNETGRFRVQRYWLTGDAAGTSELFLDNLPGYPDGVSTSPRGTHWIALFAPRNATADRLATSPFLTKVVWRLPAFLLPKPAKYGLVIEADPRGEILRSLHDPGGEVLTTLTSAEEVDAMLYLGTLHEPGLGRLAL